MKGTLVTKTGGPRGTKFMRAGWMVRWGCGGVWVSGGVVGRRRSVGRGKVVGQRILCFSPVGPESVFYLVFYCVLSQYRPPSRRHKIHNHGRRGGCGGVSRWRGRAGVGGWVGGGVGRRAA